METHDSTIHYYLEINTKKFTSNFKYINRVFLDFIIDFDIFSHDENETKKRPQFYLEQEIINNYENEYELFKNDMNTYINTFLCELKQIKEKEENIYTNEQKWIDVKLYKICEDIRINMKYHLRNDFNIIFYHSNVKNKIDKKYDDKFKDIINNIQKYTKNLFNEFNYKKKKLIQDIDNECNIKYPHYIHFCYDEFFLFDYINDGQYINDCLLYKVYNEITEEKINKIESLLYLMIFKNVPQDLVRYCIKSYL